MTEPKCGVCGKHGNEVSCVVFQTENERKRIYDLIDSFFDNEIDYIYNKEYGDEEEPMPFEEVKTHLKKWLDESYLEHPNSKEKKIENLNHLEDSFWGGVKSRLDKIEKLEGVGNSDTQVLLRAVWILHWNIKGLKKATGENCSVCGERITKNIMCLSNGIRMHKKCYGLLCKERSSG